MDYWLERVMVQLEIPTESELGMVANDLHYTEKHLEGMLDRSLTNLGFEVLHQVMAAPKFPGFKVLNASDAKRTKGMPRNPDGLPIDLIAHKGRLTLLIEAKLNSVERGIGQLLLYADIYRDCRLPSGQELALVLAAPDRIWHPRLPAICRSIDIVPWQLVTGRLPVGI